eukprot:51553-Prorocentrum_minimum.AAC.3
MAGCSRGVRLRCASSLARGAPRVLRLAPQLPLRPLLQRLRGCARRISSPSGGSEGVWRGSGGGPDGVQRGSRGRWVCETCGLAHTGVKGVKHAPAETRRRDVSGASRRRSTDRVPLSPPRLCLHFADTDGVFGSVGSFFKFLPRRGSFQANPPFVPEVRRSHTFHLIL